MKAKLQSVLTKENAIKVASTIVVSIVVVKSLAIAIQLGTTVYDRLSN